MRRILLIIAIAALATSTSAGQLKRSVPAKADIVKMQTAAPTGRIVIKFTDESALKVRESGLSGGKSADLARVNALLSSKSAGNQLKRRFDRSFDDLVAERVAGQKRSHTKLPDLNGYGVLDFTHLADSRAELITILKELVADPAVETAFLEPRYVPASLGFDAFTGNYTEPSREYLEQDEYFADKANRLDSPSFIHMQGYLGAPPYGVNATAAASIPGARGADMQLIDIEGAWVWSHEDMPDPFYTYGAHFPQQSWRDHGTAVLGEIAGIDNSFGVRGIAPEVQVGGISSYLVSVPSCISRASAATEEGDVIVIELHAPGPNATGEGQFGYVPMEYWQDNFDAIVLATANGRIVCEAAGNGYQDLDSGVYGNLFDPDIRDSGAIMCGAGTSAGTPYGYSNHGQRLNLNGWGGNVTTLAYGDLQGDPEAEEDQWYTAYFSGTSSATPIVAGAVIAVQGIIKAEYSFVLDPATMRQIVSDTGTPQRSGNTIGSRPNITAAIAAYQASAGTIEGYVTDVDSGTPLADVTVTDIVSGHYFLTGADGFFQVHTNVGAVSLEMTSFRHESKTVPVNVEGGITADGSATLQQLTLMTISGTVTDADGQPIESFRVTPLDVPLVATIGANGTFTIEDTPLSRSFDILVDNAPYYGADFVHVAAVSERQGPILVQLAAPLMDFELWNGMMNAENSAWTWGIPTNAPAAGFSGQKCWGVGMDGSGYPDELSGLLSSNSWNYSSHQELFLSLHYWSDLEDGVDGVKMQLKRPDNSWFDIIPLNGYSHDSIAALSFNPGWSGNSNGWQSAVFDVSDFVSDFIVFRFKIVSDESGSTGSFYIDDICFDGTNYVSAVPDGAELPTATAPEVAVYPNPFNPQTTINWSIDKPGHLKINIFDTRGRRVKAVYNGSISTTSGQEVWNGRDDRGRGLASGTYFVRVSDGQGRATTSRMSLVK